MAKIVFEDLPSGEANAFFRGRLWKRQTLDGENGPFFRWSHISSDDSDDPYNRLSSPKFHYLLEKLYKSGDFKQEIERFPRLGISDEYAELLAVPTISEIEKQADRWLVDEMILEKSITLLTAPPGGFKTWLALALGGAVSKGTEFLGRKTLKTQVLYLDFENPPSIIRKRGKMLNLSSDYFHVWGHWWEHAPPKIGDPRLIEIALRHGLLIIVDSFIRSHSADENSAKQMAKVFRWLRRLADAGATILLLHHQAKTQNSQYRGSTDILAGVDGAFELRKEKSKNDTILSLTCFKHRRIQETTIKIRPNWQKGCFEVLDGDGSNSISSAVVDKIKSVIARHRGISQKDLLEQAELPETNGRKILQQGDRVHWRAKRGKGTTLCYYLRG